MQHSENKYVGWLEKACDTPKLLWPYWPFRDESSVDDSLILNGGRISIPNTKRNEIVNKILASHQDIGKGILRAKTCVYWPGINENRKNCQRMPYMPKISNWTKEGNHDTIRNSFQIMESNRYKYFQRCKGNVPAYGRLSFQVSLYQENTLCQHKSRVYTCFEIHIRRTQVIIVPCTTATFSSS